MAGCRPFIGVDGCHLKGKYGGVLLSAIATDANFGIFPLAFAIVESENADSWTWFLTLLSEYLDNELFYFFNLIFQFILWLKY